PYTTLFRSRDVRETDLAVVLEAVPVDVDPDAVAELGDQAGADDLREHAHDLRAVRTVPVVADADAAEREVRVAVTRDERIDVDLLVAAAREDRVAAGAGRVLGRGWRLAEGVPEPAAISWRVVGVRRVAERLVRVLRSPLVLPRLGRHDLRRVGRTAGERDRAVADELRLDARDLGAVPVVAV